MKNDYVKMAAWQSVREFVVESTEKFPILLKLAKKPLLPNKTAEI